MATIKELNRKTRKTIVMGLLSLMTIMMFVLPSGVVSATTNVNLANAYTDAFYNIGYKYGGVTWTPHTCSFSPTTQFNQYVYDSANPASSPGSAYVGGYVEGLLIVPVTIVASGIHTISVNYNIRMWDMVFFNDDSACASYIYRYSVIMVKDWNYNYVGAAQSDNFDVTAHSNPNAVPHFHTWAQSYTLNFPSTGTYWLFAGIATYIGCAASGGTNHYAYGWSQGSWIMNSMSVS